MKIVYCISGIYNSGGMERVLSLKTSYLVNQGYEVTIITTDQKDRKPFFTFDERIKLIDLAINYSDLPANLLGKIFYYIRKQSLHHNRLKEILIKEKADIVISMFDHEASILHKINDGSKKILEIHFSRFKRVQYGRKGIWKLVDIFRGKNDEILARKYDKFVVLTEEDATYWKDIPSITNIPNAHGFEPESVSHLNNKKVIAIGRLDYQKGFEDLIKAWSLIGSKFSDWKLTIYGAGPLNEEHHTQINQLGLSESVEIHTPVSNIVDKYLDSSILVMTSKYEGLPMALLEGQVCGLPLISYACKCGPKDIIHHGVNGFIVDEGDFRGIATSLEKVMEDAELRKSMGGKSKQFSKDYTLEKVMEKWELLFKSLK